MEPRPAGRATPEGVPAPATSREERWAEEARFFDRWASRAGDADLEMSPAAWRRYSRRRLRRRFSKELRFRLLGDLAGKRVLDVGCGDGLNAATLARKGAEVTGLDVSPEAIRTARRRAEVDGLAGRTRFVCSPVETADFAEGSFDVVWGDAILHHVLDELEPVIRHLVRWTRPGGLLLFAEPLDLFPPLRRLRLALPIATEATPGERPLVRGEIELLRRHLPDLAIRHYNLFARFDRFVLVGFDYEGASAPRRALVNLTAGLDWLLLSLPGVRNLGGTGVLWGHRPG